MPNSKRQEAGFEYPSEIVSLLHVIDLEPDQIVRERAIAKLGTIEHRDAARALMDVFRQSSWRDTKIAVIRAMGMHSEQRVIEFLIRIAKDTNDLRLAQQALTSLAATRSVDSMSFLSSILRHPQHPLLRDALVGLAQCPQFECRYELGSLMEHFFELLPATQQSLIIAIGRRRERLLWPAVKAIATSTNAVARETLHAVLEAACYLAGADEDELVSQLAVSAGPSHATLVELARQRSKLAASFQAQPVLKAFETEQDPALLLSIILDLKSRRISAADLNAFMHQLTSVQKKVLITSYFPEVADPDLILEILNESDWQVSLPQLSIMVHNWCIARSHDQKSVPALVSRLTVDQLIELAVSFSPHAVMDHLSKTLQSQDLSNAQRVQIINSLVGMVTNDADQTALAKVEQILSLQIQNTKLSAQVRNRIWRAFGQLGTSKKKILEEMFQRPDSDPSERASIYYAWGMMNHGLAQNLLTQRLTEFSATRQTATDEAVWCLKALGEHDEVQETAIFSAYVKSRRNDSDAILLRIAGRQAIPGSESIIIDAINSDIFQIQLQGLAAASHCRSRNVQASVQERLNRQEQPILYRAAYASAVSGGIQGHLVLFDHMLRCDWPVDLVERVMGWIEPESHQNYEPVIAMIDSMFNSTKFKSDSVRNALITLRDNLVIFGSIERSASEHSTADQHAMDHSIMTALPIWQGASENIRAVLRNAELTFHHQDIFDEKVDKSTIIVEYVKSIDLVLQERVATTMFFSPQLLPKLQSRVLLLQLDDESVTVSRRMKDLQCSNFFTEDEFPVFKMISLTRSIVSGKILRDQYRAIDGLRAWAVILLLFARRFQYNGLRIDPILKVNNPLNPVIGKLSATLNALQERRNQAAHRGTIMSVEELTTMRNDCLATLEQIQNSF